MDGNNRIISLDFDRALSVTIFDANKVLITTS